jgi:hypothetical protein
MTPEAIGRLLERFAAIGVSHGPDHETASLLIVKEMHAFKVSWLDVLGPLEDSRLVDLRIGSVITGPRLDAFTIPQLALRYLHSLSPLVLSVYAFCRHVDLGDRPLTGEPFERLRRLHQEQQAACRAQQGANGIQLNGSFALPLVSSHATVQRKPGETQYEAIMRAIDPVKEQKLTEEQRLAAFIDAVMGRSP